MNYSFRDFTKKLFGPVWKHPKLWVMLVRGSLLTVLSLYGSLLLMQYMISQMELRNFESFKLGIVAVILFYIVLQVLGYISRYAGWIGFFFRFRKILHQHVIPRYIALDNTYAEKLGTGKTISVVEKGIASWVEGVQGIFQYAIQFLFAVGFGVYFISKINMSYAVIYVVFLFAVSVSVSYLNQHVIAYRRKRRDYMTSRTHTVVKIIMSKFEILVSGKIDYEMSLLDRDLDMAHYYNLKQGDRMHWIYSLPKLFINVMRIVIYCTIGYGYFEGGYSLAEFTALMSLLMIFDKTINELVDFYKDFTKHTVDIARLRELLDTTPQMIGYTEGTDFVYQHGDICLKDISFAYAEGKPVFDCFSLDIQGGKKTALVGLSGSGKTTLMKIIAGYMRADSGEVLVDGQSISDVSLQSYFAHIGYLTQEPSVFDGTIRENLLYGVKQLDSGQGDSDLAQAIRLAHCDFVYDLPHGLDTEIGEKGIRLSGGQRQRLAIAKIFLKNPNIILLDEPTSALDSLSEKLVSDAFHNLFRGRTVVIIAHRLQTVKEADEIIVLGTNPPNPLSQGGESTVVVEIGTHAELSVAGGTYQEMLELQSGFNF